MSKATISLKKVRPTADPEKFGQGENYKFSVAVNNGKDKNGNDLPADFYDVVAFGKTAETFCKPDKNGIVKIQKGKMINLEGRPSTGSYQKDGVTFKTFSIVLDYAEPVGSWFNDTASTPASSTQIAAPASDGFESSNDDDEMPFN